MKDTKLVRAMSTLNKEEWMSFRKYLLMQTGEESENYLLFSKLQMKKGGFDSMGDTEQFRAKNFSHLSQKSFLNLLSKMYAWLEEWMVVNEMNRSKYDADLYLLKSLNARGLFTEANLTAKKLEEKIAKELGCDLEKNRALAGLHRAMYYSQNPYNIGKEVESLNEVLQSQLVYFSEELNFLSIEMHNRDHVYQLKEDLQLSQLEKLLMRLPNTDLSGQLRSLAISMNSDQVEILYKLTDRLIHGHFVSGSELEDYLCHYLMVLARRYFIKGIMTDTKVIMRLQEFDLTKEINLKKQQVSTTRFHNVVNTLTNMLPYEQTKIFINKWVEKVNTNLIEETRTLAHAANSFHHGRYEGLFDSIRNLQFDNLGQKLDCMCYNTIGYYMDRKENYADAMENINKFKKFLSRNKSNLTPSVFESRMNLALVMEKLAMNIFKKQAVNLSNYSPIAHRKWITNEVEKWIGR